VAKRGLIAVTGSTGFIGPHLVPKLLDAGHNVRLLMRTPEKSPFPNHENIEIFKGGLGAADADFVKGADIVLHMAGLIKARSRAEFYAVNAQSAGALAGHAAKASVKRFILLSSMAARMPELSDYAGSKFAGEQAVEEQYSGDLAIIRAPAVFGPGDGATKPFFDFIKRGYLPLPGGTNWRKRKMSMVYVADLANDIVRTALPGGYDGKTVSPATITELDWIEFARQCELAFEKAVKPLPLPLPIIYMVAAMNSASSRLFGAGHLTLGKLREFLYDDWRSEDQILNATLFSQALIETANSYDE